MAIFTPQFGARIGLAVLACAGRLLGQDPAPSQAANSIAPPWDAGGLDAPFPSNVYGADHGGGSLNLAYPYLSPFGQTDHSRGVIVYQCAPFIPRRSEGVYGMDVWLEQMDAAGNWSIAAASGGIADDTGSPYQPVNTPNPGPSPSYQFQWTYADPALPPHTLFRVFVYVYLYNQGGGSQGNFYVASTIGPVDTGAANDAPRISWTAPDGATNPASVTSGAPYTISADAQDDNGNLAAVTLWKNGALFATAGGGNGWSATAGNVAQDSPGIIQYTAQAADADGLVSPLLLWTVTVAGKSEQPAVASADLTLPFGQAFAPADSGGAGSGAWQFAVVGSTNWDGGVSANAGTLTSGWSPSWTPPTAGPYAFWVVRDGDDFFNPSAAAGPYTLTVTAPAPLPVPASPDPLPDPPPPPEAPFPPAPPPIPADPPASPSPIPSPAPAPSPAPPASPVYRIRFDMTGNGARVLTGNAGQGSSNLWSDPGGLLRSPWPAVADPPVAPSGPANQTLPAVPTVPP
jgi:hypothetical protein